MVGRQAQYEIVRLVYRFAEWAVVVKAGGTVHYILDDCWPFCYISIRVTSGQVGRIRKRQIGIYKEGNMNMRFNTLWRVPIFCTVASWISFYLTAYLGRYFFVVKTVGVDGVTEVSADPLRSAIFNGGLFLIVLLLGGLWAFHSMTKVEIAVSSAILFAIYLALILMQPYLSNFPVSLSAKLAAFQNWRGIFSSFILRLTNHFNFSVLLSTLTPFLFVPFGRKSVR